MRCRHPSWDQESGQDRDAKQEHAEQALLAGLAAAKGLSAAAAQSGDQSAAAQHARAVELAGEPGRSFAPYHGRALLESAKYPEAFQAYRNR
jgi:hypothetical protein